MISHDVSVQRGAEAGAIGTPFLLHLEWSELVLLTISRPPQKSTNSDSGKLCLRVIMAHVVTWVGLRCVAPFLQL